MAEEQAALQNLSMADSQAGETFMSKFALAIVVLGLIAFAADQHFNNGRYTDDMVLTLQRMRHAIGW